MKLKKICVPLVSLSSVLGAMSVPAEAGPYRAASVTQVSGTAGGATGASPFASCDISGLNAFPSEPGDVNVADTELQPALAVNPSNPQNMVGGWQQDRWRLGGGALGVVTGTSRDGGRSWTPSTPRFTRCAGGTAANGGDYERVSPPSITFSPNGAAYVLATSFNLVRNQTSTVLVATSGDGGTTWSDATVLDTDPSRVALGRPTITADLADSNYVYAMWGRATFPSDRISHSEEEYFPGGLTGEATRNDLMFSRTIDGGRTWEPARAIREPKAQEGPFLGHHRLTVGADGSLIALVTVQKGTVRQAQPYSISAMRSTDRGATWSDLGTVAPWRPVPVVDPESGLLVGYFGEIDMAADTNPSSPGFGKLYAVWADAASTFDRQPFHHAKAYTNVVLSTSADGGRTWSAPTEVDRSPSGVQSYTPSVAIAQDGTVGITYYDNRNNTPDPGFPTDNWMIHCHPGTGCSNPASWVETHVGGPFDVERAPSCPGWYTIGTHMGLVSVGNRFLTLFTQTTATDGGNQYLGTITP